MESDGTLRAALAYIDANGRACKDCEARLRTQLVEMAPPSDGVYEYLRKIFAGTEALLATMVAAGALGGGTLLASAVARARQSDPVLSSPGGPGAARGLPATRSPAVLRVEFFSA